MIVMRRPGYAELKREYGRLVAECCRCQKCGHVQGEPNCCNRCGGRLSMPEWAVNLSALLNDAHASLCALMRNQS